MDKALGDLMSRDLSPTDNLKAARNHLGAASALLDALPAQSTAKSQGASPMTKDLNRIAETAEQARHVGEKVKEIWTTRNALVAIRDAKDPHTAAHRRFCNSESEFRSVIEMCNEPHFKRSTLKHLIRYYTGWAKMKEAHRDDLLAQLQELVSNPTQEEDKLHD